MENIEKQKEEEESGRQEEEEQSDKEEASKKKVIPKSVDNQDQQAEPDMIARANFAAERLEKANAELKKSLDRQEKMQADIIASGKGIAGQQKTEKAPMTDREYWNKVKRGEQ